MIPFSTASSADTPRGGWNQRRVGGLEVMVDALFDRIQSVLIYLIGDRWTSLISALTSILVDLMIEFVIMI